MELIEIEHPESRISVNDFILKYSEAILQKNNIQESEDRQYRIKKIENDVLAACRPYYNGGSGHPLFPRDPDTLSYAEKQLPNAVLLTCVLDTENLVRWFERHKNIKLSFVNKSQLPKAEIKQIPPTAEPIGLGLKQENDPKKKKTKQTSKNIIEDFLSVARNKGLAPPQELLTIIEEATAHGNTHRYSKNREEVLGAAVAILFNSSKENMPTTAAALAREIDQKSPLFWKDKDDPPLSNNKIERELNKWINILKSSN